MVWILAHFDAHGFCLLKAMLERLKNEQRVTVISKFPDTGPERLPDTIDVYFSQMINDTVYILDIPINVKDPATYIEAINRLSRNATVYFVDHHETDLKFLHQLQCNVIFLRTAKDMYEYFTASFGDEITIGRWVILGAICDRDKSLLEIADKNTIEQYFRYAQYLDELVRREANQILLAKIDKIEDIPMYAQMKGITEPTPVRLAKDVRILEQGRNYVIVDLTDYNKFQMWSWKVMEQIAINTRKDYVISVSNVLDRQANQLVPVVQVIKYWLSDALSPKPIISRKINRTMIGHDDAFSIRCLDLNDANSLARQIAQELETITPSITKLISEEYVAKAVQQDYKAILAKLTEILETQKEMYKEYLELKKRQVELLERVREHRAD